MKGFFKAHLVAMVLAMSFSLSSWATNNTVQLCGYVEKIGKQYEMEIEKSQKIMLVGHESWSHKFLERTYKETVLAAGQRLKACASGPYLPDIDIVQGQIVYEFVFYNLRPFHGTIGEKTENVAEDAAEMGPRRSRAKRSSGFVVSN